MTIDQFFEKLPRTRWRLLFGRYIRAIDGDYCPLIVTAGQDWFASFTMCGVELGLNTNDISSIVIASDYPTYLLKGENAQLRQRMLDHCELIEPLESEL